MSYKHVYIWDVYTLLVLVSFINTTMYVYKTVLVADCVFLYVTHVTQWDVYTLLVLPVLVAGRGSLYVTYIARCDVYTFLVLSNLFINTAMHVYKAVLVAEYNFLDIDLRWLVTCVYHL